MSYTYSQTRGNHFGDNFTSLGDYLDTNCRTTVDLTVGTNGVIPCAVVQNGDNKTGAPFYDRPHNFKMFGAYIRPIGPINLSLGASTELLSKFRYEQTRTLNVLLPGTTSNQGSTATYFYNERGSNPVDGMEWVLDTAVEATWRIAGTNQAGLKAGDLQHHESPGTAPFEQRCVLRFGCRHRLPGRDRQLRQGHGADVVPRRTYRHVRSLVSLLGDLQVLIGRSSSGRASRLPALGNGLREGHASRGKEGPGHHNVPAFFFLQRITS